MKWSLASYTQLLKPQIPAVLSWRAGPLIGSRGSLILELGQRHGSASPFPSQTSQLVVAFAPVVPMTSWFFYLWCDIKFLMLAHMTTADKKNMWRTSIVCRRNKEDNSDYKLFSLHVNVITLMSTQKPFKIRVERVFGLCPGLPKEANLALLFCGNSLKYIAPCLCLQKVFMPLVFHNSITVHKSIKKVLKNASLRWL